MSKSAYFWDVVSRKVIQHAANAVIAFASIGIERSMNQYNKDLNKPQSTPKKKQQKPDNKA